MKYNIISIVILTEQRVRYLDPKLLDSPVYFLTAGLQIGFPRKALFDSHGVLRYPLEAVLEFAEVVFEPGCYSRMLRVLSASRDLPLFTVTILCLLRLPVGMYPSRSKRTADVAIETPNRATELSVFGHFRFESPFDAEHRMLP